MEGRRSTRPLPERSASPPSRRSPSRALRRQGLSCRRSRRAPRTWSVRATSNRRSSTGNPSSALAAQRRRLRGGPRGAVACTCSRGDLRPRGRRWYARIVDDARRRRRPRQLRERHSREREGASAVRRTHAHRAARDRRGPGFASQGRSPVRGHPGRLHPATRARRCHLQPYGRRLLEGRVPLWQREALSRSAQSGSLAQNACRPGDAAGCTLLGTLLEAGAGVPRDLREASRVYARGCADGQVESCQFLGGMLLTGRGIPRDSKVAASALTRACRGGAHKACSMQ